MSGPDLRLISGRRVTAVRTPAPVQPRHPDERLAQAVHNAWSDGYDTGQRGARARGWLVGLGYGLLAGVALAGVALWAAVRLGLLRLG